jgi:arginyl-tRNA synthetase
MIDKLNEEISKFLSSFLDAEDEKLSLIEKKCSSTITDDLDKGHITSNVCMIAASILKTNPKEIADALVKWLKETDNFYKIESAGPGFINVTLKRSDFVSTVNKINKDSQKYGESNYGNQYKLSSFQPTQLALCMLGMEEELPMEMQ